jgi:hypothetical protein
LFIASGTFVICVVCVCGVDFLGLSLL